MVRIALIVIAATFATDVLAGDCSFEPKTTNEINRIDPAKTLLLIQRIKNATGGSLVVS